MMEKIRTVLKIDVEYDPDITDPEGLAFAADILLQTSLSIPGVLEEYGNPSFGKFEILYGPL